MKTLLVADQLVMIEWFRRYAHLSLDAFNTRVIATSYLLRYYFYYIYDCHLKYYFLPCPYTYVSVYLLVRILTCPYTYVSVYLLVRILTCPYTYVSVYLLVRILTCPYTYVSVYLLVCILTCPYTYVSVYFTWWLLYAQNTESEWLQLKSFILSLISTQDKTFVH